MNGGNRTSVSNIVSGVVFSDQNLDTGGELVVGAVGRRQNVFTRDDTATTPGGRPRAYLPKEALLLQHPPQKHI